MRLLLVEDEPDLGAAIEKTLTREAYIVDWALTGTDAWNYLQSPSTKYDLAILDWLLPGISGIEICQKLREQHNPLPILILTAKDTEADKVRGLDAGADDYLVKPFGMAELLARLRALQRRIPQFQPQKLQVGTLVLDSATHRVSIASGNSVELLNKEFQILEYLMRHPHQIIPKDRLLSQLWEWGAEPSSNVVAAQIRLLRRKLATLGANEAIETVYGVGYRLNLDKIPS
ncbi:two-component system response regulator [Leptolyngbya valderiana BDU 20041]|nr:response regulator transcription factor [Geitlerinema sp. CS-897]OAB62464.1 two-component system response regulator [Leptolyngbya valderiana BDU 20041]